MNYLSPYLPKLTLNISTTFSNSSKRNLNSFNNFFLLTFFFFDKRLCILSRGLREPRDRYTSGCTCRELKRVKTNHVQSFRIICVPQFGRRVAVRCACVYSFTRRISLVRVTRAQNKSFIFYLFFFFILPSLLFFFIAHIHCSLCIASLYKVAFHRVCIR